MVSSSKGTKLGTSVTERAHPCASPVGYCIAVASGEATGGSGPEVAEAERHRVKGTDADRIVVLGA